MDGYGGDENPLQQLAPEELRQLLQLGTVPDQQQQLQQQLLRAQALRGGGQRHSTPLGALLGGVAGAGGELAAGLREHQLEKQMAALPGQQVDGRLLFLQKMLGAGGAQPSPMGEGDVMPSSLFGLG